MLISGQSSAVVLSVPLCVCACLCLCDYLMHVLVRMVLRRRKLHFQNTSGSINSSHCLLAVFNLKVRATGGLAVCLITSSCPLRFLLDFLHAGI